MKYKGLSIFTIVFSILLTGGSVLTAEAQSLLYDVDFGTPPHTVGQPPVTGAGPPPRDTITSIQVGSPIVVSSFGALTDQPLEYQSPDQILLRLNDLPSFDFYCIESEILVQSGARFAILQDTPIIRNIEFQNQVIHAFDPDGSTDPFPGTPIGAYSFGTPVLVRSEVDLASDTWRIFINDVLAYSGSFSAATQINTVRWGSQGTDGAIDNIRIFGESCPGVVDEVVGGELLPIDSTALLVATVQSPVGWLTSITLAALGVGAYLFTRNPNNVRNIKVILQDYLDRF